MDFLPNPLIIPVGLFIGILVAAPVGPVNVLCVQRAIERGFWGGVAAGIGSVLGDGLIALSAGMGANAIASAVELYRWIIQTIGGLALVVFGLKLYYTTPRLIMPQGPEAQGTRLRDFAWDIPQTFFLTITNPGAVLGLFAIFGGVSTFVEVHSTADVLLMVAAIMTGSLLWWVGLSNLISRHRHRIDEARIGLINRVAGWLLGIFGLLLVAEVIWKGGQF